MIASKKAYREYIHADMKALGLLEASAVSRMLDPCYRFQKAMRKHEYFANVFARK